MKKIVAIVLASGLGVLAQNIDLTGTVTNAVGGGNLQGVIVTLKNTPALFDTTKADGTYSLVQTTAIDHVLTTATPFSGSRMLDGVLEIGVTRQEPVTVEAFGLNGVLRARLVHDMMPPGLYKVDIRGSSTNMDLRLIRVRQGDKTTVYRVLPTRSSNATGIPAHDAGELLSKRVSFADTLVFTLSGFTTGKLAVTTPTGSNNIALSPLSQATTVTDIDGNVYHAVTIGTQVWMAENLKTTKYNDGDTIPQVTTNNAQWVALTGPGYCWYNNDSNTYAHYGALYNWYTVNTGKLAPTGWHVATDSEWTVLTNFLGGVNVAGGPLRNTDSNGFAAVQGGYRFSYGTFTSVGTDGYWWTSTQYAANYAWYRSLGGDSTYVGRFYDFNINYGFNVRCVQDGY